MRIVNKKALHNYHILESFEAGIKLFGSEVKSIRQSRIDLSQSFARVLGDEVYLVNAHVPPYQNSPKKDYDPVRTRKLLLHKGQIKSLIGKTLTAGVTLVPVAVYDRNNLIKVSLGLARSKKLFDKRKVIKERDQKRRVEQELRGKE